MAPQVNGEVRPSSATLSHITDYPVVHDGITYFKKNPLGQKSIELGDSAYQTFAKPVMPYFAKPYQYVSPYVEKADMIGDDALSKIDERLPVLKKSSDELWTDGKSIIFFPLRKSMETKDHFFTVYNSEYKKCGGDNLVTYSKALVSTGLVMTSEVLSWVGDVLRASKAHAKESGNQMEEQAKETGQHLSNRAQETGNHLSQRAQETGRDLSQRAQETGNHMSQRAQEMTQ